MAKEKMLIIQEIDNFLMSLQVTTDGFDPADIAALLCEQSVGPVREYLELNMKKLVTQLVQQRLKNASGSNYFSDGNTPKQQVFDFAIPVYTSFRDGNGKAKYIKSNDARYDHFRMAAEERLKQSVYDKNQSDIYQSIAARLKETPEMKLSDALKLLEATSCEV